MNPASGKMPNRSGALFVSRCLRLASFGAKLRFHRNPVRLDTAFREISLPPRRASPARAACAACSAAALLVLDPRSGITGGISTVALIRSDANLPFPGTRQLTPFSVAHRVMSIPTFGSGYLPRFVTPSPAGHSLRNRIRYFRVLPARSHRDGFAHPAATGPRTASFTAPATRSTSTGFI